MASTELAPIANIRETDAEDFGWDMTGDLFCIEGFMAVLFQAFPAYEKSVTNTSSNERLSG